MNIIIAGGGKTVYFLCRNFISKGYKVTVINKDHDESVWLARKLKVISIYGDWSSPSILEEAGANFADVALAVTPNDHDNLAFCQIANLHFKVSQTFALVNDPDNEDIFKQLGVPAISTTHILSNMIEQRVGFNEITNLITVGEGKINITELDISETSLVVGKQVKDIQFPKDSLLVYVIHDGKPIVPKGDTILYSGDHVFVVSLPENYAQTIRMLTGEGR
jgi:trk system potassium uptake protein TrkA